MAGAVDDNPSRRRESPMRLANKADWARIADHVKRLPWMRDGNPLMYVVDIREAKSTRSLEQNARYWALLTEISKQAPDHMGGEWHDTEVWHEYLKRRFIGVDPGPFGGGVAKSSRKLKVGEFADYMTEVEVWADDEFTGFSFEYQ